MGLFSVPLVVGNIHTGQSETVDAMVDTGAVYSMVPASLLRRLEIEPGRTMRFSTASGDSVRYEVGEARFSAAGETCYANVVFGPEGKFLLGAMTLEGLALAVDPMKKRLIPEDILPL